MDRIFQILAVVLAGVAAYFLWQGSADRAFIAAVFGAVSFFLSVRVQVKGRLKEREAEREEREKGGKSEGEIEDSEPAQLNEMPAQEEIRSGQLTTDDEQKI